MNPVAAVPQHIAERLCLSGTSLIINNHPEATPQELGGGASEEKCAGEEKCPGLYGEPKAYRSVRRHSRYWAEGSPTIKMTTSNTNAHMPAVSVRMAGLDDAEKITTLINSSFRRAEEFFIDTNRIDCASVRNFLVTGQFLLAEREGTIVGCVYVEPRSNARAYLGLLAVDPARQQSGLGSLLMDAAEDHYRRLGCHFMDINVVNLRQELAGFYQRRGYVETGTSPFPVDVKTKLPCHFIEMSKSLITF